jgi:ribose 5-phosphate isomerase B
MKVAIDADNNGLELKRVLVEFLNDEKIDVRDLAYIQSHPGGDYPDVAYNLAKQVRDGIHDRGILICGTGLGMAICANKVQGVFAGSCSDVYAAERLIKSNNARVLTLGAQVTGPESAKTIVRAWIHSEFNGGRSLPKVERMMEIERESFGKAAK